MSNNNNVVVNQLLQQVQQILTLSLIQRKWKLRQPSFIQSTSTENTRVNYLLRYQNSNTSATSFLILDFKIITSTSQSRQSFGIPNPDYSNGMYLSVMTTVPCVLSLKHYPFNKSVNEIDSKNCVHCYGDSVNTVRVAWVVMKRKKLSLRQRLRKMANSISSKT